MGVVVTVEVTAFKKAVVTNGSDSPVALNGTDNPEPAEFFVLNTDTLSVVVSEIERGGPDDHSGGGGHGGPPGGGR